jgi:hypothetical protein
MKIELNDDFAHEVVVESLKDYHEIMLNNPEEDGVCNAIEIVLSHYLNRQDYITWYKGVYGPKGKEIDFGEDVGLEIIEL